MSAVKINQAISVDKGNKREIKKNKKNTKNPVDNDLFQVAVLSTL